MSDNLYQRPGNYVHTMIEVARWGAIWLIPITERDLWAMIDAWVSEQNGLGECPRVIKRIIERGRKK